MKVAVLGTGMVGAAIGTKLLSLGHEVRMGSRSAESDKGRAWLLAVAQAGLSAGLARVDTFAEAARDADLLINCTGGAVSIAVLESVAVRARSGKILVDISNPLDFTRGMPPTLSVCNTSSLGEQIQAAFPELRVVKTLNTVSAPIMVAPELLPEQTALFLSGNDAEAKQFVEARILREAFGWQEIIDLGDITTARGTEMYLPLWIRLWGVLGSAHFNVKLVRA